MIDLLYVGWKRTWQKWPDTEDTDFSSVLAERAIVPCKVNGQRVDVRVRWWPIHRGYVAAGIRTLPLAHPYFDNTKLPAQPVLDAMVAELTAQAKECRICYWDRAHGCYPPVAQHLKRLFPLSILFNADDSPGSTEIRTQPVARFFDVIFHGNIIWTKAGDRTADLYRGFGLSEIRYVMTAPSEGFEAGLRDAGWLGAARPCVQSVWRLPEDADFDLDRRIRQLRVGDYDWDLVSVAGLMGERRMALKDVLPILEASGLRVRFHGVAMPHGILPPHPMLDYDPRRGIGWPVAGLYLRSFAVLSTAFIGHVATRLFDAWASGTLAFADDPVGEMAAVGIKAGEHYVACDGTPADLVAKLHYYKTHLDEAEAIIRRAHAFGRRFPHEHGIVRALEQTLAQHPAVLG